MGGNFDARIGKEENTELRKIVKWKSKNKKKNHVWERLIEEREWLITNSTMIGDEKEKLTYYGLRWDGQCGWKWRGEGGEK